MSADVTRPDPQPDAIARLEAELEAERSARRRAELRADEFQRLLDDLPALVSTARGPGLVYDFVNRLSREALQGTDIVGRRAVDAFPELVDTGFLALIEHQLATDTPWIGRGVPSPILDASGRQAYFDVIYHPLHDVDGQVEGLLTFSYDVTETVEARLALQASEDKFRQLADTVDHLVWTLKADGVTVEDVNARFGGYTGATFVPGQPLDWPTLLHPDDLAVVSTHARAMIPEGRAYDVEYRLRNSEGDYRWFLGRVVPQRDADGRIVRWFGTATDIHHNKMLEVDLQAANAELEAQAEELRATNEEQAVQAEELASQQEELHELYERLRHHAEATEAEVARRTEELQAANEALGALDRSKDEFLSVISHELRTPLNFITGFASTLDDEVHGPLNDAQHGALGKILNGADRMLMLVNDLLDVAKLESGRFDLSPAPTAYRPLVEDALALLKPLADAKGLALSVDEGPAATPAIDAARITQVLTNLIGNAIKFTDTGGVRVRYHLTPDAIVTDIVDSGPGIAEADRAKLFQRFSQLDMSVTRRASGTGLGLAISKALVAAHGGAIGVKPNPDGGSIFWFSLPLVASGR